MSLSNTPAFDAGLHRTSHVALHRQLAERLRDQIARGELKAGDQLPTELALMERYGISRITARHGLDQLVKDGLVIRQRGKGTFVAPPRVRHDLHGVRGLYEDLVAQGLDVATSLVSFDRRIAPAHIASLLSSGGDPVASWRRLYKVNGTPFAISDVHLAPFAERVTRRLAERNMTYTILEEHFGIRIERAAMTFRSAAPDQELRHLLRVGTDEAILVMERVSYAEDGRALEHTVYRALGHHYEFSVNVQGRLPITPRLKLSANGTPGEGAAGDGAVRATGAGP